MEYIWKVAQEHPSSTELQGRTVGTENERVATTSLMGLSEIARRMNIFIGAVATVSE